MHGLKPTRTKTTATALAYAEARRKILGQLDFGRCSHCLDKFKCGGPEPWTRGSQGKEWSRDAVT
jgi:hypothetical protein